MNKDNGLPDDEEEALVRLYAARHAQAIVKHEGAAIAASVRTLDEKAIAAANQRLAIAIAQAIVDIYYGGIDPNELEP